MAVTNTTNYSLAKPDQGTTAWHTYVNGNMDTIDSTLAQLNNLKITSKSANATLAISEHGIIDVTTGASTITITLPTAVGNAQTLYIIKKIDSGVGTVSIATTSSQTIDGVSTKTLTNQNANITLVSDGSNWIIVVHNTLDKIGVTTLTTTAQDLNSAVNEVQQMPVNAMTRQAIINGNFDNWIRGTSFTNSTSGSFTADRFSMAYANTGTLPTTIIHSKQQLTTGDIANSFSFYRINVNGAGSGFGVGDSYSLAHKIEYGVKYLCGLNKKVTISFYAKSDIVGKRLGLNAAMVYGTGGSPSSAETLIGQIFTLSSTWTKYTLTLTTNTLVGKTFGTNNDDTINLNFSYMWGTTIATTRFGGGTAESFVGSGNIDIAQLQLNAGDTALPFQPKNPTIETNDCQRFTVGFTDVNTSFPIGNGSAISTTQAIIKVDLPQEMRSSPALTATATDWQLSDGVTATDLTAISISSGQSSNKTVTLLCTVASGLTQYRPYQLIADGTANRLLIFYSEL